MVEDVGRNVTGFEPDDEVLADLSEHGLGGFAEYVCVPSTVLVSNPAKISFEAAATVPTSGVAALQSLRDAGRLQAGEHVLINGASGGVGTFAVQIAKSSEPKSPGYVVLQKQSWSVPSAPTTSSIILVKTLPRRERSMTSSSILRVLSR